MTITELSKMVGRSKQALYYMQKHNPKLFELLQLGGQKKQELEKIKKELRDESKN